MKKMFVLDTNVVLHDSTCVFHFEDNDVAIPITVIEELDSFKRGHDQINFNAREFIRFLDQFPGDKIIDVGESLGEGTKVVFTGDPYQIDTPYLDSRSTGLSYLIDRMKGQPLYGHVTMQKGERSELAELASDLL